MAPTDRLHGLNPHAEVRMRVQHHELWWLLRSVGVVAGFGSKGGNLSRMVHNNWKNTLYESKHYIMARTELSGSRAIWISAEGLMIVESLLGRSHPHKHAMGLFIKAYVLPMHNGKRYTELQTQTKALLKSLRTLAEI